MKTFSQMQTNVGNMVMDTSSALATLIGRWLNDGYRDIWRRSRWTETINNDYSFVTVASGSATSCTADASTDAFTASAHGLKNGDLIYISGTTVPTGTSTSTPYYVIYAATNTFQIATTKNGTAVDLTSAGTAVKFTFTARDTYDLPKDFQDELYVVNFTDGENLRRYSEGLWWEERYGAYANNNQTISPGPLPSRYVILREHRKSDNTGFGVIQLDPPPNAAKTIGMPYRRKCNNLLSVTETCTTDTANKIIASAGTFITDEVQVGHIVKNSTDTVYGRVVSVDSETQLTMDWDICPDGNESVIIDTYPEILDIEDVIEAYACSSTCAYKKQYPKAAAWQMEYENRLAKRIRQERSKPNQKYQWIPETREASAMMPFTGWNSYDSL